MNIDTDRPKTVIVNKVAIDSPERYESLIRIVKAIELRKHIAIIDDLFTNDLLDCLDQLHGAGLSYSTIETLFINSLSDEANFIDLYSTLKGYATSTFSFNPLSIPFLASLKLGKYAYLFEPNEVMRELKKRYFLLMSGIPEDITVNLLLHLRDNHEAYTKDSRLAERFLTLCTNIKKHLPVEDPAYVPDELLSYIAALSRVLPPAAILSLYESIPHQTPEDIRTIADTIYERYGFSFPAYGIPSHLATS